jgi:hypothetical protein
MSAMRLHGAHEVVKYMPQGMKDGGTREYVRICITSKPSNAPPHHIVLRKHVANLLGRIATASEQPQRPRSSVRARVRDSNSLMPFVQPDKDRNMMAQF